MLMDCLAPVVTSWVVPLIAQSAAPAGEIAATPSGWSAIWSSFADNAFALTILFIFLTAIVTVLIQQRRTDKCLKLLRGYHVSYMTNNGQVIWGDLMVYSLGLELVFDAPHLNDRQLSKESAMIYDNELPTCLALARVIEGQTEKERQLRERQIQRSFRPGILRRTWRWTRNIFNTLRDAFGKAFSAALGQIAKVRTQDMVLNQQRGSVDQIGQTILSTMGNAYEPMLERHIGKPVVLELACPNAADKKPTQLPGYLVDYSDRFVAVFNVEHTPEKVLTLDVTGDIEQDGFTVKLDGRHLCVTATGMDAVVLRWIEVAGQRADLAVVLINGTTLRTATRGRRPIRMEIAITRKLDIVCPRAMGKVKFGSGGLSIDRQDWAGRAPEEEEIQRVTPQASTSITTVTTVSSIDASG